MQSGALTAGRAPFNTGSAHHGNRFLRKVFFASPAIADPPPLSIHAISLTPGEYPISPTRPRCHRSPGS